jgi:hypothetical protein
MVEETLDIEPVDEPESEPLVVADVSNRATKAALTTLYGSAFPPLREGATDDAWADWADALWVSLEAGMFRRLHEIIRNRLFRRGEQWIASNGRAAWKEPAKPSNAMRPVHNLVAPALDQRVQLASEQRPGVRVNPATGEPEDRKKAEAVQAFLEYQYNQQERLRAVRELLYWVGTDGTCFEEIYWHPDRGPWDELMGSKAGDICSRVRRIEQVRVSPNATATQIPYFWVIRDMIPVQQAVAEYGEVVAEKVETDATWGDRGDAWSLRSVGYLGPDVDELLAEQQTVARYTVYCDPNEYLPKGLTVIAVGNKTVFVGELLCGMIPMVRWTDGSTDPSFYCSPEMNKWLPHQMRINAALAKFYENLRYNAAPKLMGRSGAVKTETLIGGTMTFIEVQGLGPITENVQIIPGQTVSGDVEKAIQLEVRAFENLSGWNDTTRGSFSADQSGRAILAIREQVERIFAPLITSAADSQTVWAKLSLAFGKQFYDLPRMIAVQGEGRPDLVRSIRKDDLDGAVEVWIDPETMFPMPRSLKLFLLKDLFQSGVISPQEYRRRQVFSWVRNLGSSDEDQEARAMRVVELMRTGQNPQVLFQDDPAIHQDALTRELILPDDTDPQLRQVAIARWEQYAQLQQMQQGAMQGAQMGPPQPPPQGAEMPPTDQPFQGSSPPIAAGSLSQYGGAPDGMSETEQFEQVQPY